MPVADIALRFDAAVVVLSYLTAAFASYVALDLAQRVRTPDAAVARIWWIAGSLSMGTGIWAMKSMPQSRAAPLGFSDSVFTTPTAEA